MNYRLQIFLSPTNTDSDILIWATSFFVANEHKPYASYSESTGSQTKLHGADHEFVIRT